jgi:uridylate kinase
MNIERASVMAKISGEQLGASGIDEQRTRALAREILEFMETTGRTPILLPGGGNFTRGRNAGKVDPIERSEADYEGMVGTARNASALADALNDEGHIGATCMLTLRLEDRLRAQRTHEDFDRHRARDYARMGRIVVIGGGTGLPYCCTDLTCVIFGGMMGAERIMKGTATPGVMSDDPRTTTIENLELYRTLSFDEAVKNGLNVLEPSAWAVARDEVKIPINVYDMRVAGNMISAFNGKSGTLVSVDGATSHWPRSTWVDAFAA